MSGSAAASQFAAQASLAFVDEEYEEALELYSQVPLPWAQARTAGRAASKTFCGVTVGYKALPPAILARHSAHQDVLLSLACSAALLLLRP